MLTFVISLLAGVATSLILRFTVLSSTAGAILPGILVFVVIVMLLLRRTNKQIEPVIQEAQKHITGGRAEMAIKTLEGGLALGAWNPLVPGQLRSMIGSLYYDTNKLDKAEENLARAVRWPWNTKALLGVVYFKKRDETKMIKAFETAVKVGKKEPVAWTLYAYCLNARGKKDESVKVLERALKEIPGDQRLQNNLELAKEGKKLKTAPYAEKWQRFRVDNEGPVVPRDIPKAMRGFAVRPGFRQKPKRK